jgi:hypothetical protein
MAFPLVTSLAVTGLGSASILTATAVVALFLAHEPLVVLLGHRGRRIREQDAGRAWLWFITALIVATTTIILAIDATPPAFRWTFLVPVLPAAWLFRLAVHGREKTSPGETSVAIAFAAAALPICGGAGRPAIGLAIAASFALLFVLATLAVRVIILRTRGGGNPQATQRTRMATLVLAAGGTLLAVMAASGNVIAWSTVAATLPGVVFATALAAFPPPAVRLRKVGWTLIAVSALTSVLLIVTA